MTSPGAMNAPAFKGPPCVIGLVPVIGLPAFSHVAMAIAGNVVQERTITIMNKAKTLLTCVPFKVTLLS